MFLRRRGGNTYVCRSTTEIRGRVGNAKTVMDWHWVKPEGKSGSVIRLSNVYVPDSWTGKKVRLRVEPVADEPIVSKQRVEKHYGPESTEDVDLTGLAWLFGDGVWINVLDAFLGSNTDLSATEVCSMTGNSRITVKGKMDQMEHRGILAQSREVGNATLYSLNKGSGFVRTLIEFYEALAVTEDREGELDVCKED